MIPSLFETYIKVKLYVASKVLPHLPVGLCNFGFNGNIIIEPTNACNLKCPLCPTSQAMTRRHGFLSLEDFRFIIDTSEGMVNQIFFNFAGEPLLNRDVFDMVRYAHDLGIKTMISTNTTLLDKHIDTCLESGLDLLVVCLDGASAKTHEAYRVGSRFESVAENIRAICARKKELGLETPLISLQFVVMKQNEYEVEEIKKLAKELGVDYLDLKTVSLGSWISLERKQEIAKEYLPENPQYQRFETKDGKLAIKSRPRLCSWLKQAAVYWNGDVSMCCYDFNGELVVGNVFDEGGFAKLWRSRKYKEYRKKVILRKFPLCRRCNLTDDYGETIKIS